MKIAEADRHPIPRIDHRTEGAKGALYTSLRSSAFPPPAIENETAISTPQPLPNHANHHTKQVSKKYTAWGTGKKYNRCTKKSIPLNAVKTAAVNTELYHDANRCPTLKKTVFCEELYLNYQNAAQPQRARLRPLPPLRRIEKDGRDNLPPEFIIPLQCSCKAITPLPACC